MTRTTRTLLALGSILGMALTAGAAPGRWTLDFENGLAAAGYCDVQIPKSTGTLFSLTRDFDAKAGYYFRVRVSYQIHPRHSLSLLVAPLTLKASGVAGSDIWFNGSLFPAGSPVEGRYTFNSYRLTYRYELTKGPVWKVGLGFTAKIRDAAIRLESGTLSSEKTNVGFVPLLNFRVEWAPGGRFAILLEGDALAAKQGRAEDVALLLLYRLSPWLRLKAGYRFVEGGANVEEVKNFAYIHYAAAGLVAEF